MCEDRPLKHPRLEPEPLVTNVPFVGPNASKEFVNCRLDAWARHYGVVNDEICAVRALLRDDSTDLPSDPFWNGLSSLAKALRVVAIVEWRLSHGIVVKDCVAMVERMVSACLLIASDASIPFYLGMKRTEIVLSLLNEAFAADMHLLFPPWIQALTPTDLALDASFELARNVYGGLTAETFSRRCCHLYFGSRIARDPSFEIDGLLLESNKAVLLDDMRCCVTTAMTGHCHSSAFSDAMGKQQFHCIDFVPISTLSVLDYAFYFGLRWIPGMPVAYTNVATVLAVAVSTVMASAALFLRESRRRDEFEDYVHLYACTIETTRLKQRMVQVKAEDRVGPYLK